MVGSAWMPWERPDHRRRLVFEGAALERGAHLVDALDQKVGGAHELHVEAGVEHVRRGHALMDEPRLRPDDLGEMGEEGDDVVLDLALDLVDAGDVEVGVLAFRPDGLRRFLRHDAERGERVGGMGFDLEPDPVARLRVPDRGHLGPGVAGDHGPGSTRPGPAQQSIGCARPHATVAVASRDLAARLRRRAADRRDVRLDRRRGRP